MHNMHEQQIDLNETARWDSAKVDVEAGIIRDVKLLGETSKNGNHYPLKTRQDAHKQLEGIRVNVNHPDKKNPSGDTPVQSRLGKFVNVREQADGTYADLHFLKAHTMAPVLVEAAQRMPELLGFSINGKGTCRKNNEGKTIVESIDSLRSVDLVADAATTKSLFESEDKPEDKPVDLSEVEQLLADVERLKEQINLLETENHKMHLERDCRQLLESENVTVEAPLMEALMHLDSDDSRKNFVVWHKRKSIVKAPRSSDARVLQEETVDLVKILRSK